MKKSRNKKKGLSRKIRSTRRERITTRDEGDGRGGHGEFQSE